MNKIPAVSLFIFISAISFGGNNHVKDTTHIYKKIDTTYIENYRDKLNGKLIAVVRSNKFSIKDNVSQSILEYSINTNTNLGMGLSFKGIGVEFQVNPKGLNRDDNLYGKSTQFSLATSANSRRFIYDAYLRYNQGYHTTAVYRIPTDTTKSAHIYRPDIRNTLVGLNGVYVFNNKHFSSSAPYSLTQKQKKGAGSFLLGAFISFYTLNADSVIFPDSLKKHFKEEVQFKDAGSINYGISFGYTYTFVFFKNWFVNVYLLPGLSFQQYYSTNAYNEKMHTNQAVGGAFMSRFSMGYNRKNYFLGLSAFGNNYVVNNDKKSSLTYHFGSVKFYYGYRFDVSKPIAKWKSHRAKKKAEPGK